MAELGADRKPIHNLMDPALAERARLMDPMDPGPERKKQFKDETDKILKAWKADRANMSAFWKKFFGVGLLEAEGKALEKPLEKIISKALEAAPTAATATTGALAGLALQGPLLASGAGVGIALVTHAAKTYAEIANRDAKSPYRYLTLMEEAGVLIRAEGRGTTTPE
ncbi:hypothetical protein [Bradyrhizobium sp. USDA 4451]